MNIAKDFCDCIISWEVQENRKISNVVHCSYPKVGDDKSNTDDVMASLHCKISDEIEMEYTPVLLTPFLHPELTKASYCDLKIFISPKLGVKLDRLKIVSTAKMTEFYDRNGELAFSAKGEKITTKVERGKDDSGDRFAVSGPGKNQSHKTSSRWFMNEYVPSTELFEVMIRFCDHLVPNQLLIKYIGVKIVPHDWSIDIGPCNLAAPTQGAGSAAHIGSTGSISSKTVTINCDKVMEAMQNVNNAVQILANEVGCTQKGSNPYLSTTSTLDSASLFKHRRPNSPMTIGPSSSPPNCIATRRSSDISNLQLWMETRLTAIEVSLMKGLEQLSNRISQLETQLSSQHFAMNESYRNGNPSMSDLTHDIKTESNCKEKDSSTERNSSCPRS